ncbi:MAG: NPCBM/NEW2 domain-containing protein [Kiritimatiellae bacterium]|nr:NPCBM/NEW2 domain-containing protein [Kiritimatiellia bacterium]
MKKLLSFCFCTVLAVLASADTKVWLDELDLTKMACGWGKPKANKSVGGNPLHAGRQPFERGVGSHSYSIMVVELNGNALSFEADVAVDDEEINNGHGSVSFRVYADNKVAADTGVMRSRDKPRHLKVDLTGAKTAMLEISDGGDGDTYDHADWCNAFFTVKDGAKIKAVDSPTTEQFGILTPAAPISPRINGAKVFGVRPNRPILFTVPVTGAEPVKLSVKGLPDGAKFDSATGRVSGSVAVPGTYDVTITAKNKHGKAESVLKLVVGDTLALTPPMGWNSWNCFASAVSDVKIRQAAEAMVNSGLIKHGWSYINIDDFWQNRPREKNDQTLIGPERDANGKIVSNKRFPDMKALADYVHGLGLKIGLYSSPGPTTCGGCTGSWEHEWQDAQSYAEWGYDYLKYDWCSYGGVANVKGGKGSDLRRLMYPYLLMSEALRAQNRDIILSLCQYGMGNVSTWGAVAGGQCWRTTGDIVDTWGSMRRIADAQDGLGLFSKPGAWNDPDMLIVGKVGWGPNLRPTRLTHNEQYTHISIWCLVASPLLIGCDMTDMDDFTLNLLTNDEVLEVNQDPLGFGAAVVERGDNSEVWLKKMADGSYVAGLVNRGMFESPVSFDLKAAKLDGIYRARDLWRQQDIGQIQGSYQVTLPGHAPQLIRLYPVR